MKLAPTAYVISTLIVIIAIGTWASTGREGYTRWPDAKLAQTDAPMNQDEDDLFTDIGFESDDELEITPNIESRFVLGLVPGGISPQHLLSVASAVAFGIGISIAATLISFRNKSKIRKSK